VQNARVGVAHGNQLSFGRLQGVAPAMNWDNAWFPPAIRPRGVDVAKLAFFVVLLVAPVRSAAASVPVISGPTTFVISDCNDARIPLRFIPGGSLAPIAIRTKDIVNETPKGAPVGWSISWDKPLLTDQSIAEYQTLGTLNGGCPLAGTFDVPLTISLGGTPPSSAELKFTLVRIVDPVLDAPVSVMLPLNIWPFGVGGFDESELSIPLRETSYGASVDGIVAVGSELKNASGELAGIMLISQPNALKLGAGAGANLGMTLSQTPDPGSYTGKITLHAPTLKQNQAVDVTLKVRVCWVFLLVVIGLGVGLGYLVNVSLRQRAELDAALLEGLRASAAIAQRAAAQKDPAVQQRLINLAAYLEGQVKDATTTKAVDDAVTAAQSRANDIETMANKAATDFGQNLARLRSIVQPSEVPLDDAIDDLLASLKQTLDRIDRVGTSGDVEEAQRCLQQLEQIWAKGITNALRPWLVQLQSALDDLGPWADANAEPELTRKALKEELLQAYAISEPGKLVQQCDAIARQLRSWVTLTAPGAIAKVFRVAATILVRGGAAELGGTISSQADDIVHEAAGDQDPLATVRKLAAIRTKVEELFRRSPKASGDLIARLAQGDFSGAAALLVGPAPSNVAPSASRDVGPSREPLALVQRLQTELRDVGTPPAVQPRLLVPPQLSVKQTVRIEVNWADTPVPDEQAKWSFDPTGNAQISNATAHGTDMIPLKAGLLTIIFGVSEFKTAATTYVGDVSATQNYRQISKQGRRANFLISGVTALITIFAGYEIFVGTWFGTFGDFFSAFLWGFFGQFGLDRLRDLSKSIVSRPLT